MAREQIDIGVEGNDGTGDSIRESFRKTNENFRELYAVFGEGGQIEFTSLGDTPQSLLPNTIPLVNDSATFINLAELASNSALDPNANDTITFDYSVDGKLVISTAFTELADDVSPLLGGPLNVGNNPIGNVSISETAAGDFNARHNTNITIDDLVITKGFADRRYITTGLPIRVADEPENTDQYILEIQNYVNGNLEIPSHGIDRAANGTAFTFDTRFDDPDNLTSGETYFIRFVTPDQIALFDNSSDAELIDDTVALDRKIRVSGLIANDDRHIITDAAFDPSLKGNFLEDVAMPRSSVVRRQGDNMEGTLFLSDHPGELSGFGEVNGADDLQAATKFYVDNSSFSSTKNLFVSTSGDDRMIGVPEGREGTSQDFAFRTINAAAKTADEIVRASDPEPGPYIQTVTYSSGGETVESQVTVGNIVGPENNQARKLIEINKDYLIREYIGYLEYNFPDFIFDRDTWQNDIEIIIDAIKFDINRSDLSSDINANTLTRRSAERFYATPAGRFKIRSEQQQLVDSIEFVRSAVDSALSNRLYRQRQVQNIIRNGERATVTTSTNHGLETGEQIVFKDIVGMEELEDQTAYVRVINDSEFELYKDAAVTQLFDISSYGNYTTNSGRMGVVYQPRVEQFQSIKILQSFDEPDAGSTAQEAVESNFNLVIDIIENGISAGQDPVFGNNYKVVLETGDAPFLDQANPSDLDMIPGKILVGKSSGARGRIVKVTNNDPTENDNDSFELVQLNEKDFETGETVEYGNFVKKKQITIFVESGIYEEDLPIKLSDNVSIKGDEFRRVIVRPNRRASQSIWADTYFYRDLEFDNINILEKRHSTVTRVGNPSTDILQVDSTDWMSQGKEVKFAGQILFASELTKTETYFIKEIVSETEIKISASQGGPAVTFSDQSGTMYIVDNPVSPFLNQTNDIQGYFGRHYLLNPFSDKNVGELPTNRGSYNTATNIVQLNKSFIIEEILRYTDLQIDAADSASDTSSIWYQFSYDSQDWQNKLSLVIDSISKDLIRGGSEFALESQGKLFETTPSNERQQLSDALAEIETYTSDLLVGQEPSQEGNIRPDTSIGEADPDAVSIVVDLINLIRFGFDENYNPPKNNDADGVDVFQMSDATIVRNVTVQGQGGFMVVLDPQGQVLTKSPYIQTGSSFSKSNNEKRFRGGMYVDAFVGNIPVTIDNVVNPFELEVSSATGQGLFIRPPLLPAPFYLDGVRYQVNAISKYDSANGTATISLDSSSNPDSSQIGQGYTGSAPQEIFIQTAGNRSMLGNDFTQINDLGYGLVTNNGAVSEMVSMFTYYCQVAYYAKNGSEIRSLNGSNGYGNFGLVAEGADPNEIPDQVTLLNPMAVPCKAYTTVEYTNAIGDPFITVYDLKTPPTTQSIITIDHGSSVGVFNYRISAIDSLTDIDGESATGGTFSNEVYRLSLRADPAVSDDFFEDLQATVSNDTFIEFRNVRNQIFEGVRDQEALTTRPSTAINFDESDLVTYRSLDFSTSDSLTDDLENDEILSLFELDYDFIELKVDINNLSGGFGDSQGDTNIAIEAIPSTDRVARLTRDVAGRQPGDDGYSGGMIFTFAGKTHQVFDYVNNNGFSYIDIQDVSNTNVNDSYTGNGLAEGIPSRERSFFAGLQEGATAEITIAISLLRATGHDFTQIGAGGYNDSNYPNVIFGRPNNLLAQAYTDGPTATSAQVWERRKGRVFFVTTDQDGFFRVGKFFSVDQATGDIEFAGEIGLTGANALGFTRGVTINEFSADDSFTDLSNQAVPTERATGGYINRVLGYNVDTDNNPQIDGDANRIGPGFLALNGFVAMEGDLNLGSNQIKNLAPPTNNNDAARKDYVDERSQAYDEFNDLRNIELNSAQADDIIVGTGKKRIFITPVTGGTIDIGDTIVNSAETKAGVVVDTESLTDDIEGVINIITYTQTDGVFQIGEDIFEQGGTATSVIIDGPVDEFANASESTDSVVNLNVSRTSGGAEFDFQIQDNSLTNADVNNDAAISQSKLALQKADTFDEDDGVNGWNGTADKTQADLGLAKFSDENFDTDNGFVRISENGVAFSEMNTIDQYQVFGRTQSGVGSISAVDFSDVVELGLGITDTDFEDTVINSDTNFPGEALIKLSEGVYGVSTIAIGPSNDSIVRRDNEGEIDATAYKLNSFDILSLSSTTLRLDTPEGARVFNAVGSNSEDLVTRYPGNIDVGETARSSQSSFQSGSSFAAEGWLAADWIYTSFIEAGGEGDSTSTGIGLGAGTGFANAGDDAINLVTGGDNRIVVTNSTTSIENSLDVNGTTNLNGTVNIGDNSNNDINFVASVTSNVLPDQNGLRNIGSSGTRWDVMYANIFNGTATEAKYADLAENYQADSFYEAGTVVVFGGEYEVTITDKKADQKVAGVVSSKPAYLMNSGLDNQTAVPVALQGRVPCKVLGKANKGDLLVTSAIPGYAVVNNDPRIGTVIGKSLEDKTDDRKGTIEIVVGKT